VRILDGIAFRIRRLFGRLPLGRPDVLATRLVTRWIRVQKLCTIESDLQIRGSADALRYITLGTKCGIDKGCIIWIASEVAAAPSISLGDRVYVGPYCYLGSYAPLEIGSDTIIGAYSYLITANHRAELGMPVQDQGYEAAPIRIGRDVWIGCHVVILPGVTIGDHAVIGAGAIVNRDVPAGEKWAGVPAKKIGIRS
jgi:acetyltransferase-like isoleucine patch superfamily enzyme